MDNSLRQDFLKRTVAALETLIDEAQTGGGKSFSENFRREAFRSLHTIKGTAQTIGFTSAGKFAHELENLLAAAGIKPKSADADSSGDDDKTLFVEGLRVLKKTFEQTDYQIPAAFLKRIGARVGVKSEDAAQIDSSEIPKRIYSQLTNAEKSTLRAALQNEREIFCLEINFESASFADDFARFRQTLCDKCEIVATLPAEKADAPGSIGFRFLISAAENIEETVEKTRARIVFQSARTIFTNDLTGVLAQIAASGETLAERFGKQINFEIDAPENLKFSPEILKTIFDALNHLVRNALDHAIEPPAERTAQNKSPRGAIKIDFTEKKNEFYLTVADDGRGIDAKKIREKAVEKNIGGGELSEKDALALIFTPEFSTRDDLTEISGRGIGLDAVKCAVEKIGGAVSVKSESGKGTTFEIRLPRVD